MDGFEVSWTLRNVLIGSSLLGVVGGVLGSFALLRRQSLIGDALAHAALPGICLAFFVTREKSSWAFLIGALIAGLLGSLCIMALVRGTRIKEDTAIGIVLSVFFGVGIVLLTKIQRLPDGNQSGLSTYLFGQAATLLPEDLQLMAFLGAFVLAVTALLYKEFKLISFDRAFASSLGLPVRTLDILLTALIVIVVVFGLRTVGVVLMIATLITPAAAARQWTDRLGSMIFLSAAIGGLSGTLGAVASATFDKLPTGPSIVLVSSTILMLSLLMAPRRGMLWAAARERAFRLRIKRENLLKDLYRLGEPKEDWRRFVTPPAVMGMRGQGSRELERTAAPLIRRGLIEREGEDLRLTEAGVDEAADVVRKHRLWELFLTKRLELPTDHVHRDAEAMEHALSDEAVEELDELLGHPELDPHGRRIPRRAPS